MSTVIEFHPRVVPTPVTQIQAQHVTYERHLGVRAAVGLMVSDFSTRAEALRVLLRSVERQARLSGCGRVHLDPDAAKAAA